MKKRVFAVLLTLCMLLALVPAGVLATDKVYAKIGETTTLAVTDSAAAFYVAPAESGVYRIFAEGEEMTIASDVGGIVDMNLPSRAFALGSLEAGKEYFFHLNDVKTSTVDVTVERLTEKMWELEVFMTPSNRVPVSGQRALGVFYNGGDFGLSISAMNPFAVRSAVIVTGEDCIKLEETNGEYMVSGLKLGSATVRATVTLGGMTKTAECALTVVPADDPCLEGHDLANGTIKQVVAPTATEHGIGKNLCPRCGDGQTFTMHNFVYETVKQPTQTEHGIEKTTCTVCDLCDTYNEVHNWVYEEVEPTETTHGSRKGTCTVCNLTTPTQILHYYNHEVVKEPTQTEHGLNKITCTVCKESDTIEICNLVEQTLKAVSPKEHGKVKATCTVCKNSFEYDLHAWKETVKKASTATEHGIIVHSCQVPGCELEPWEEELPLNTFADIALNANTDWYYAPVLWAVENKITEGMGKDDTFVPEGLCTRAQVVTFLWRAAGRPEPKSTKNPFVDVKDTKDTSWYYKAVLWAVENGITIGADATHFDPYAVCNRAMVATFIWRANGEPAPLSAKSTFSDVTNPAEYYYNAVLWATENGVINGMGDGTYAPLAKCQRSHVVAMLYRDAMR